MDDKEYSLKGIKLTDNIITIKQRIELVDNTPIDAQILIFGGIRLENSYSLQDYSIPFDSILHLVTKKAKVMDVDDDEKKEEQILVKTLTGKVIPIEYKASYTIGYIKSRVQDIESIPVGKQRLVFRGQQMEDDRKCKEYEIKDGNTLQLVIRLRNDDTVKYVDVGEVIEEKYEDGEEIMLKVLDKSKTERMSEVDEDIFMQSGLGKLTAMLQGHLVFMKENEEYVDKMLLNVEDGLVLKEAKLKAVEVEQEVLLSIMMDVISMSDFIKDIVLCENLFNKLYTKQLKKKQEAARIEYAKNINKYDVLPIEMNLNEDKVEDEKKMEVESSVSVENKDVESFVKLIFSSQTLYLSKFKKWIELIEKECDENGVKITESSGAQVKKISRAFYKAFYVYKQDGYKKMTDILRASMVFDTFDDIYKAFNIIDKNIDIIRVKDRFEPNLVPFGYRDILINFYCPDSGIICELQLHHTMFYEYKKVSHDIYKKARLFDYGDGNYAYQYAQQFARPKIGDIVDIVNNNNNNNECIDDLMMNGKQLLNYWGLSMYDTKMIDKEGWNDPNDWKYLKEDDLKNDIGFKDSHIRKFMGKYKQWSLRKEGKEGKEENAGN